MSEYQYYEFLAIDRPLSEREMGELRESSSRRPSGSPRGGGDGKRSGKRGSEPGGSGKRQLFALPGCEPWRNVSPRPGSRWMS